MQYSSTYAMGAGTPYHGVVAPSYEPLPAPKPAKTPISTKIFTGGMAVLFVALLLSVAGVPGHLGYNGDAPGKRVRPTSNNPLAVQKSMDSNLRWMATQSDDQQGHYVGEITRINQKEVAIPAMLDGVKSMNESVLTIDAKLREVLASTKSVGGDMQVMAKTSVASNAKMQALGGDVNMLSTAMGKLGAATQLLTERMADIQTKAQAIAASGTSKALASAKVMDSSLPDHVPAPPTVGAPGTGAPVGGEQ